MRTSPPACRRGSTQSCRRSSARPVHVGDPRSGAVNHQAPEPMGRQPCSRVSARYICRRFGGIFETTLVWDGCVILI
eukprot:7702229-Pyramimonas_sp.AAC.1